MKSIGVSALLILSAHWAFASDFAFPSLKYDQREPGSLPSAAATGRESVEMPQFGASGVSQPNGVSGGIDRRGIIDPTSASFRSTHDLGLIDPDYKLRILKAPKVDQEMVVKLDAK